MRAVWLILAAGFRRQWKSWLLLTVLIAVASGFVLASTAAGRRTDSAFPRYVASTAMTPSCTPSSRCRSWGSCPRWRR
jgi:hypothetical protein